MNTTAMAPQDNPASEHDQLHQLLSGAKRPSGPLSGVLGISFTGVLAGPTAANTLEGQGATLIKIEPVAGDSSRGYGPFTQDGRSTYHISINCGTQSITINLADQNERAILDRLLAKADFFLHNQRPDVMQKFGYGREEIAQKHPDLINCQISGDGANGVADGAFNETVLALTGLWESFTGIDEEGVVIPKTNSLSVADLFSGLHAANAISGALFDRVRRMAKGQPGGAFLDCSMKQSVLSTIANMVTAASNDNLGVRKNPSGPGDSHSSISPFAAFRCADDPIKIDAKTDLPQRTYIVIAAGNETLFTKLATALGHQEWTTDDRFSNNQARLKNKDALRQAIETALKEHPASYWDGVLQRAGVPRALPVKLMDLVADPHARAKHFVPVLGPAGEELCLVAHPGVQNCNYERRTEVYAPSSTPGADKETILAALDKQDFSGDIHNPFWAGLLGMATTLNSGTKALIEAVGLSAISADDVQRVPTEVMEKLRAALSNGRSM